MNLTYAQDQCNYPNTDMGIIIHHRNIDIYIEKYKRSIITMLQFEHSDLWKSLLVSLWLVITKVRYTWHLPSKNDVISSRLAYSLYHLSDCLQIVYDLIFETLSGIERIFVKIEEVKEIYPVLKLRRNK